MNGKECWIFLKSVYALHPHVEVTEAMVEVALFALEDVDLTAAMWALKQRLQEPGRVHAVQPGEILETLANKERELRQEEKQRKLYEQRRIELKRAAQDGPTSQEQIETIVAMMKAKYPRLFE